MSLPPPTYRRSLFSLLACLFLPLGLAAFHIVGGEFRYTFLGYKNDNPATGIQRYRIIINMYRDDIGDGAWFDGDPNQPPQYGNVNTPGHVTVYRGSQVYIGSKDVRLGSTNPVPINLGNPCLVITEPIKQQIGIYTFDIEIEEGDETYTLAYQRCCRNENIRNIIDPTGIGATYFIQITPTAQARRNSSPKFNIDPPIAICINEEFYIDLGASDTDGDSLAYKMCDPKIGAGIDGLNGEYRTPDDPSDDLAPDPESNFPYISVPWNFPRYSTDDQLGVGSVLRIDPFTGELYGIPRYPGTHVLAICVEEWSRGPNPVQLSETKREFQLNVARCDNAVTADLLETEIDEFGRFFIRQCGFGPNTIVNQSTDERIITSYDWEMTGPGGQRLTGSQRNFRTEVNQRGVYEGVMYLNRESAIENCKDTARFLLGVYPGVEANFVSTEVACDPIPIEFTNLSEGEERQRITNYRWDFADGSPQTRQIEPAHQYRTPGDHPVELWVEDENGCTDSITKISKYFPAPRTIILEPQDAFGCVPYGNHFINNSFPIDSSYTFEWRFGDGGASEAMHPRHTYENAGIYDVYLSITSPLGCFVDTSFLELVDVRPSPAADFDISPEQPTISQPTFRIYNQARDARDQRYVMTDRAGGQLFSTPQPDFDWRLRDTNTVFVTQMVTHPSGCRDTLTKLVRLALENPLHAPNAFTPNGDGLNDTWKPKGIFTGATGYQLRVWNRWGERLFITNDPDDSWDGSFKGKNSPAGGYLWDVQFVNAEGEAQEYKGGVVLIR